VPEPPSPRLAESHPARGEGRLVAELLLVTLAVVTMAFVGTVLVVRVPANKVGRLLLVAASFLAVEFLAVTYAQLSGDISGGTWPGTVLAVWLYSNVLAVPVVIMAIGIPLIFPNGHLLSPRWRWVAAAVVLTTTHSFLKQGFSPGLIPDTNIENPFAIPALQPLLSATDFAGSPVFGPAVFLVPVAAVAVRYRRGASLERQQLKWLIAVTAWSAISWSLVILGQAFGAGLVTGVGWVSALLAMTGLPVAIGIAVLRYRLYAIDRIISRTLSYGVITAVLLVVFATVVVGLQTALTPFTRGSSVPVAISTLVVFALFQPLRRRVQRAVDVRFDRANVDRDRTASAFAERLGGQVDMEAVTSDLQATIDGSIRPRAQVLWLRQRGMGR
jgi:hypothetical protein